MNCFNTIQYDIDLKLQIMMVYVILSFNTIQYDIDLKHSKYFCTINVSFNTIQYDIDLKPQIARSSLYIENIGILNG